MICMLVSMAEEAGTEVFSVEALGRIEGMVQLATERGCTPLEMDEHLTAAFWRGYRAGLDAIEEPADA